MRYLSLLFALHVLLFAGCIKKGPELDQSQIPFDAPRKVLADKIISCFENDNPEIQYAYIENINDGRGFTAGRAGFTTGTGDLLVVVQLYTQAVPGNPLAQYLPTLQTLAAAQSSSTAGLEGLPTDWQTCANDPRFRSVQDQVSDSLYYQPALVYAQELGLKYPLSLLCLYDACIQHGDGDDPDGLSAIIDETNKKCGGSPAEGIEEYKWLYHFNKCREKVLKHPANEDTRDEWRESVGRVDALESLRKKKNFLLDQQTIEVNPYGTNHVLSL